MLKIAIVDDEAEYINILSVKVSDICSDLEIDHTIDNYYNGYDIIANYEKYHLIFLDIEMQPYDGIKVATKINELKDCSEIPYFVFVTSHDELVFDALKSFPFSFIRKNKIDIDLYECISHINSTIERNHKTIILHSDRNDIPVIIDDIIYLEKIKNYVIYHTANRKYKVRSNMNKEFEKISDNGFIRPHIGYAVNNIFIEHISENNVFLKNGITIPLNTKYKNEVKSQFFKWLGERNG